MGILFPQKTNPAKQVAHFSKHSKHLIRQKQNHPFCSLTQSAEERTLILYKCANEEKYRYHIVVFYKKKFCSDI